jgi:hypothetical protein
LVLLCRHHHTLRHNGGFDLRVTADGTVTIHRPDGSLLPYVAPGHLQPLPPPGPPPTGRAPTRQRATPGHRCRHRPSAHPTPGLGQRPRRRPAHHNAGAAVEAANLRRLLVRRKVGVPRQCSASSVTASDRAILQGPSPMVRIWLRGSTERPSGRP